MNAGADAPVPEEELGGSAPWPGPEATTGADTTGADTTGADSEAEVADGAWERGEEAPTPPAEAVDVGVAPSEAEEEGDPLRAVSAERDEYLDTLRRVQADFENYKKRMVRQQTEHLDRAAEGLVSKLLPALDTLELAVAHNEETSEAGQSLRQVYTALYDALGKEGLDKVEPLGQEFDPNEAEAVMREPAEEGQSGHLVVEVLRPGYRWRGRVLRAAMVKVKG